MPQFFISEHNYEKRYEHQQMNYIFLLFVFQLLLYGEVLQKIRYGIVDQNFDCGRERQGKR